MGASELLAWMTAAVCAFGWWQARRIAAVWRTRAEEWRDMSSKWRGTAWLWQDMCGNWRESADYWKHRERIRSQVCRDRHHDESDHP